MNLYHECPYKIRFMKYIAQDLMFFLKIEVHSTRLETQSPLHNNNNNTTCKFDVFTNSMFKYDHFGSLTLWIRWVGFFFHLFDKTLHLYLSGIWQHSKLRMNFKRLVFVILQLWITILINLGSIVDIVAKNEWEREHWPYAPQLETWNDNLQNPQLLTSETIANLIQRYELFVKLEMPKIQPHALSRIVSTKKLHKVLTLEQLRIITHLTQANLCTQCGRLSSTKH